MDDLISRQAAINRAVTITMFGRDIRVVGVSELENLPSIKPERDIPMKPMETTDRTWGVPKRQAVCPKCNCYLGHIDFIGDGKRVTYCESCGQAIDWEGWKFDE